MYEIRNARVQNSELIPNIELYVTALITTASVSYDAIQPMMYTNNTPDEFMP